MLLWHEQPCYQSSEPVQRRLSMARASNNESLNLSFVSICLFQSGHLSAEAEFRFVSSAIPHARPLFSAGVPPHTFSPPTIA
nr:hypothetical protein [uncultured Pseudomonas sp.]